MIIKMILLVICQQIFLPSITKNLTDEQLFREYLLFNPEQCRPTIIIDESLSNSAQFKAEEMAFNDYFSHTSEVTGITPNELATMFGFDLHDSYPRQGNNIESLAAGVSDVKSAYTVLINSPPHREHMLGTHVFFCQQLHMGFGYAFNADSKFKHYFVVWLARKNEN